MKNEVSPSQIERRAPTKDALYALLDTLIPLEIKQRGIDATRRARLLVAFVFFNLGACLLIYPSLMPYYPATHILPMITLFNALGYSALLALMWVGRKCANRGAHHRDQRHGHRHERSRARADF